MNMPLRIVLIFLVCGVDSTLGAAEQPRSPRDALFQIATLSELAAGDYDGRFPFRVVKARGDFGLGTFDQLDGEMVAVDGKFYQVRADGVATRVHPNETTPFAAVTFFEPDIRFELDQTTSCDALRELILEHLPAEDVPYAVKVTGFFSTLQTRSVPPQQKPYVPLDQALQEQVVFDFFFVDATMVGFWLPEVLTNVNAPGFHFHALTNGNTAGGHVLNCEVLDVTVEIDTTEVLQIQFGTMGTGLNDSLGPKRNNPGSR